MLIVASGYLSGGPEELFGASPGAAVAAVDDVDPGSEPAKPPAIDAPAFAAISEYAVVTDGISSELPYPCDTIFVNCSELRLLFKLDVLKDSMVLVKLPYKFSDDVDQNSTFPPVAADPLPTVFPPESNRVYDPSSNPVILSSEPPIFVACE